MELFKIGFISVRWMDLVDIALVAFISYRLYIAMRRTIAVQILAGLLVVFIFSLVAQALELKAMSAMLKVLTDLWVLAFIILFQPELRRLLVLVGRSPIVRFFIKMNVDESIDEVVAAVTELSKKKMGALIIFTRASGIRMFSETGTRMDALVSRTLLLSISTPAPRSMTGRSLSGTGWWNRPGARCRSRPSRAGTGIFWDQASRRAGGLRTGRCGRGDRLRRDGDRHAGRERDARPRASLPRCSKRAQGAPHDTPGPFVRLCLATLRAST